MATAGRRIPVTEASSGPQSQQRLLGGAVNRRPLVHAALVIGVVALAGYQVRALIEPPDLANAALAFTAGWVLCVALVASRDQEGIYSPAGAYLAVFGLFHGGLLLSFLLRGEAGLPGVETRWFLSDDAPVAATLASIGMIAFALATYSIRARARLYPEPSTGSSETRVLGMLGLGVQAAGLAIFAVVVLGTDGRALAGYASFLAVAQNNSLLPWGILAMGVGPVLAIAAGGRARVVSWSLFTGYAMFAFPLGLRGEVLFPLVAMLVVEVRRGMRVRPLWTAAGALLIMMLIGIVRVTRAGGASGLLQLSSLASPLDAVAEMGYSLRPTVVVLEWHRRGEPFSDGETFIAVPLRAVAKLLGEQLPKVDFRLFDAEILARVGGIGCSPVAEAYHNFGTAGVVGVMALYGVVIAWFTRADRTPLKDAFLGALLVILLIQVRNGFAPVPLQIALLVGLLGIARVLARTDTASLQRIPRMQS